MALTLNEDFSIITTRTRDKWWFGSSVCPGGILQNPTNSDNGDAVKNLQTRRSFVGHSAVEKTRMWQFLAVSDRIALQNTTGTIWDFLALCSNVHDRHLIN